ncbi:retropepsin-like aspartic protease [Flavobacterium mekongense]|uniref:retropepsin-like aspartic protease n=1 Tax=Flavobacterium mekongense TaxID=3379707 RepID=UPI00399A14A8
MANPQSLSFTLEANGILRQLITPCGICKAFDPLTGGQHPKVEKISGLWDTGATGSVITKALADKLGLVPFRKQKVYHADGDTVANVYAINIFLPNQVAFAFIPVTEGKLTGFDMLIGMDIISRGDLTISNFAGKTTFSFRTPSTGKLEFDPIVASPPKKPNWLNSKSGNYKKPGKK